MIRKIMRGFRLRTFGVLFILIVSAICIYLIIAGGLETISIENTSIELKSSIVYAGDFEKLQVGKMNKIIVHLNQEIARVNQYVFGSNFLGHESLHNSRYKGYMNFGAGIWDGKWDESVEAVSNLAKSIGITIVRFPGGCGTHSYDWKKTIGKDRIDYWFGLDEFMKIARQIEAAPILTVSYFLGNEDDAADLVEYLNLPNDRKNINNGIDWAQMRAKNGYVRPYNVKYFEIGNEVLHGNHKNITSVLPSEYATQYRKYYSAMKAVDPTIKIGVVLSNQKWNENVLHLIGDKVDFGIVHTYPAAPVVAQNTITKLERNDIFKIALGYSIRAVESNFHDKLRILQRNANKEIPLAVTEYNAGFRQEKPVPYRHSLGAALINSEMIRLFMQPELKIIMANYWNFANEYWGMVANGFNGEYESLHNVYYKRPNYYLFKLYHDHFGEVLVNTDTKSEYYNIDQYIAIIQKMVNRRNDGSTTGRNLLSRKWQTKDLSGIDVKESKGVLSINFVNPKLFNYFHTWKQVKVEPNTFYKISGYIKSTELIDQNGICLEVQDSRGWKNTRSAICTARTKGTTDWRYVEAIYGSLPDASFVNIYARRIGNLGPLKGEVFIKGVKFEKYVPNIDTRIPYLSVNASKNDNGDKVYLMVINKNLEDEMPTTIELKDFVPAEVGNSWTLNGPSVDATNEKKHDNVKITHKEFVVWDQNSEDRSSFEFTFEPHSLTAIELDRHE